MLNKSFKITAILVSLCLCQYGLSAQSRSQQPAGSERANQRQGQPSSQNQQKANPSRTSKANVKKQPVFGTQVSNTPRKSSVVEVNKTGYRYSNGIFYHPKGTAFVPGPGPVGARIASLPNGHTTVMIHGTPYFYFYGTFYLRRGVSAYEVIEPPLGAVIYDLPLGFEKVIIDNVSYYVYGNTYFKAIIDSYGEVAYEVVGKVR